MMNKGLSGKFIWVLPAVFVCMLTALYFCGLKKGYHEDEYYSFYSTARTAGLSVEDRTWKTNEEIRQEYEVLPGERFRYGLVKEVQSWDVHPPVYYWLLHTVESLMPGCFDKWIGLTVNLAAYFAGLFLFACLGELLLQKEKMIPLAVAAYGLSPAALSGVTFIRMYALLTVFIFWAAVLHCRNLTREELTVQSFFLPLSVCSYLGFLTQYYYFVFLFFLAGGFCVYRLWAYRRIKDTVCYGVTMIAVFGAAYLTYPAFPGQMFRGQRGAQAASSFFEWSNTLSRLRFFFALVSKYVFGGILPWLLLLMFLLAFAAALFEKKRQRGFADNKKAGVLLTFASVGYFLTVSKTGLLLGDSSIRYQMPICGILILLVLLFFSGKRQMAGILCAALLILLDLYGLSAGRVLFLYGEDAEKTAFAEQCAKENIPAVYFYDSAQDWCIWDSTDELLLYPEVFFCEQSSCEPIADERICSAEKLVVYISSLQDEETSEERIFACNPQVTRCVEKYRDTYCSMYVFE